MSWTAIGAIVLGYFLLKAIFDSDANVYRCPNCNLVVRQGATKCSRCKTPFEW